MTKSVKRYGIILNEVATLSTLPYGARVIVFYDNSITLSHLIDLRAALSLDILVAVNSDIDFKMLDDIFTVKKVDWDFIDGDLVGALQLNDEHQLKSNTSHHRKKKPFVSPEGLYAEAEKVINTNNNHEVIKEMARTFRNMVDAGAYYDEQFKDLTQENVELRVKNAQLEEALNAMSQDLDDFIRTYKIAQAQMSARNVVDVIKDTNTVTLPSNVTTLVIKNYGIPSLMRFVLALKDCLTTSFSKYVKVLYIAEPDSVAIQEINRSKFLELNSKTKAADLLRSDMMLCIGSTKEPIEYLVSASSMDILIIVDSRRTTNQLIKGETLTMFTAMDLETASNMGLDPSRTITSSERSTYTLRESDFTNKKKHVMRNNELVLRVANTLVGST